MIEISHADADAIVEALSDYQKLAQWVLDLVFQNRRRDGLPYDDDGAKFICEMAYKIETAHGIICTLRRGR